MNKIFTSLIILISLISPLAIVGTADAYDIVPQCNSGQELNDANTDASFCPDVTKAKAGTNNDPILKILKVVMTIISFVAGIAAVILVIISGIKFSTSGGDPGKVSSAKGSLINALIGVIIVVFSQTIVVFVLDKVS